MGIIPLPPRFLNVVDGALRDGRNPKVRVSGYRGVIRGIDLATDYYDNRPIPKLNILMVDDDIPEQAVISGRAFNEDGSVTTWTRMLLQRLNNPENMLKADETIDLRFYPATGESRSTCCVVYRPSSPTPLKGMDFARDSPTVCRELADAAIEALKKRYGVYKTHRRMRDDEYGPAIGSVLDDTTYHGTQEPEPIGADNELPF